MRAVTFDTTGGPDVLHVAEVDEPHAGPGQVRVAVRAAAVNPFDWKVRSGRFDVALPHIPGYDAAGLVDEVGDGVTSVAVGDAVFGHAAGAAYAEHAVLEAWAPVPDGLSFEEAAGFVTAAETAQRSLDLVGVGDGDTLVIAGASGGVGSAGVQLAVARGARVIGTAGPGNQDYVRSLGAEPTLYGDGLVGRVRELAPDGVSAGFDTAGKGAVRDLIELTGDPARVVTIADFGAGDLGAHVTSQSGAWEALGLAADLWARGRFALPVAQTFPFEAAAEAHRVSEDGHVRGKLVLVPSAS